MLVPNTAGHPYDGGGVPSDRISNCLTEMPVIAVFKLVLNHYSLTTIGIPADDVRVEGPYGRFS